MKNFEPTVVKTKDEASSFPVPKSSRAALLWPAYFIQDRQQLPLASAEAVSAS